jgi:Alpha-L-arabinofuranosidase B, catalytic
MKTKMQTAVSTLAAVVGASVTMATAASAAPPRPQGPCDIYSAARTPCVAAHSTTRALYASYSGPLYQVKRQPDGKKSRRAAESSVLRLQNEPWIETRSRLPQESSGRINAGCRNCNLTLMPESLQCWLGPRMHLGNRSIRQRILFAPPARTPPRGTARDRGSAISRIQECRP